MHRPLIPILVSYLFGLITGYYISIPRTALLSLILLLLLLYSITITIKKTKLSFYLPLLIFNLLGILFLRSTLSPPLPPDHITHHITEEKVVVEGILYKSPEISLERTKLYLKAEKIIKNEYYINVNGYLLLTAKDLLNIFNYGDRIRFSARIRHPRNFNNPGGFDYRTYLALKGIRATASLKEGKNIIKVGEGNLNIFLQQLEQYRTRIRDFLTTQFLPPASEIMRALILGEKGALPKELREAFSIAGTAHILAISGLHSGIIALLCFFLIKNLLKLSTRLMLSTDITKVSALITLIPVITYCFIAGLGTATIRATIMVTTYLIAIIIDRQEDIWNTLALAAFLILIFSPSSLFDISFQLSFISVAAILYFTPRFSALFFQPSRDILEPPSPWWKKVIRRSGLFSMVTVSAIVGTAPLVALYFHRVSPWGFLTNLVIIPLVGFLVVPCGLLASLLLFICQPLAVFIAHILQPFIKLSIFIVKIFNQLPYADYRTVTPTLLEIALFYLGVLLLVNIRKSRKVRYALALVTIIFICNQGFWYYRNNLSPLLRITSIDVGQSESTLIQLPHGATMLIDGGGFYESSFDTGERIVAPLLWKKKISTIDYLVLSHPHPDHLNGLLSIAKIFKVKEFWTTGYEVSTAPLKELEQIIEEKGIKKLTLHRESPNRKINGVLLEFLHPPKTSLYDIKSNYHTSINNHSLTLRLTYQSISMLFTGDISREAERELITTAPDLKSTILKVPHHGSATSSSLPFLKQVQPQIAIFSLGFQNIFNFPSKKVFERYQDMGSQILRTDQDGAITIETDGSHILIKTFPGRETTRRGNLQ